MGAEYDTSEIRRVAKRIGAVSDQVAAVSKDALERISAEIPHTMKGETAEALNERVTLASDDIRRIAGRLAGIRDLLIKFARLLDEADEKAKGEIQTR